MKVVLVNCSPHKEGSTFVALSEIGRTLRECGVDAEIFHISKKPLPGCMACGGCDSGGGKCVIDDVVNEFKARAAEFDGFIFGAPVHYAGPNASATAFMDRLFFSSRANGSADLKLKPAAAVCVARRAGSTAALDRLNKYFQITQMPIISSQYWNLVHGLTADDVPRDEEGLQIMRTLARNMAWFLRCKEAGAAAGVPLPESEPAIYTNFVR